MAAHKDDFVRKITACMKKHVAVKSPQVLKDTVTVLTMKGWEKREDTSFGHGVVERLAERFQKPLENASIDCSQLQQERDDILLYGQRHLNLTSEDYKCLWWKLFNSVDAGTWKNILGLVELLFCLLWPMAVWRECFHASELKNQTTASP